MRLFIICLIGVVIGGYIEGIISNYCGLIDKDIKQMQGIQEYPGRENR